LLPIPMASRLLALGSKAGSSIRWGTALILLSPV
jgi:hypothetical protein